MESVSTLQDVAPWFRGDRQAFREAGFSSVSSHAIGTTHTKTRPGIGNISNLKPGVIRKLPLSNLTYPTFLLQIPT